MTDRSSNDVEDSQFLKNSIAQSLQTFYDTYSPYLGEDANKLSRDISPEKPVVNLRNCVRLVQKVLSNGQNNRNEQLVGVQGIYLLVDEYNTFSDRPCDWEVDRVFRSFWSAIKSLLSVPNGIQKAFITDTVPLAFAHTGGRFDVATNLASNEDVAGLCGLTRADIEAALEKLCGSDIDAYKKHLQDMTTYLKEDHFCNQKTLETIYNTDMCLAYLQRLIQGTIPEARHP